MGSGKVVMKRSGRWDIEIPQADLEAELALDKYYRRLQLKEASIKMSEEQRAERLEMEFYKYQEDLEGLDECAASLGTMMNKIKWELEAIRKKRKRVVNTMNLLNRLANEKPSTRELEEAKAIRVKFARQKVLRKMVMSHRPTPIKRRLLPFVDLGRVAKKIKKPVAEFIGVKRPAGRPKKIRPVTESPSVPLPPPQPPLPELPPDLQSSPAL